MRLIEAVHYLQPFFPGKLTVLVLILAILPLTLLRFQTDEPCKLQGEDKLTPTARSESHPLPSRCVQSNPALLKCFETPTGWVFFKKHPWHFSHPQSGEGRVGWERTSQLHDNPPGSLLECLED